MLPGETLVGRSAGDTRLVRQVASSLLGEVYEGLHPRLGRVAVKVLSSSLSQGGEAHHTGEARLLREAHLLAELRHPNIVAMHQVGYEGDRLFVVMEWLGDAQNLRWLGHHRPLTPTQSIVVIRRLCDALTCLHERSLVHRDIKPGNICLKQGGHPVLMDLSLIKDLSAVFKLTQTGTVLGTVNFMPPEQVQGAFGEVGPRSDLYGLGATLFWLLTGRTPFRGKNQMDTIVQALKQPAPAPSTLNISLPTVVDGLVAELLAKTPAQRPESAGVVAARLDDLLARHRALLDSAQPPPPAARA